MFRIERKKAQGRSAGRWLRVSALFLSALIILSLAGCRGFFQSPIATGIAINPSSVVVGTGSTLQLSATATYDDGSTGNISKVTWTSSNPAVATVSSSGVVSGVATGTATITAQSNDVNGTATVTVIPGNLTLITVTPANPTVISGGTQQFTATGSLSTGGTYDLTSIATWSSSDTTVATIDTKGLATGQTLVSVGQTVITAKAGNISGTTTLTVSP